MSQLFHAPLTPGLNELVVVDRLALRLLIDLGLGRAGLVQPFGFVDLGVQLWTAFFLRPCALDTLHVLVIGMIAVYGFDVLLRGIRGYISSHTTARLDAMIGSEVVHRLFN